MNGLFEQDEQLSKARLCTLLAALLGATIMLFPAVQAAARSAPALDPVRLYGPGIEFDVLRNGVKSGLHRVSFAFEAGTLSVKTEFRLQIDVLFVTLYRFTYSSVDLWRDDALEAVRVEIDDDGMAKSIQARRAGARYAIDAGGVTYLAEDLLGQFFALKEYFPRQFAVRQGMQVHAASSRATGPMAPAVEIGAGRYDAGFLAVIDAALALDPADRPGSAGAMIS